MKRETIETLVCTACGLGLATANMYLTGLVAEEAARNAITIGISPYYVSEYTVTEALLGVINCFAGGSLAIIGYRIIKNFDKLPDIIAETSMGIKYRNKRPKK